jgi:hypothetical protein
VLGEGQAAERGSLAPAAGPSAGIAVLAVGTTFDWPSGLIVVAALVAVITLLGLACARRAGGFAARMAALVMVAVGLVLLPTTAQMTYVELGGLGGPGLSGLWTPFALAGLLAFAAASVVVRLIVTRPSAPTSPGGPMDGDTALPAAGDLRVAGTAPLETARGDQAARVPAGEAGAGGADGPVPGFVAGGLVALVAALCAVRLLVPSATGMPLVIPLVLLAAGAAVAVSAALVLAGPHAGLFGLSLCLPAVLSGFLLGSGIQVGWLRAISASGKVTSQAMVDGFVGALHIWALIAGFVVVAILVLGAVLRRRDPEYRPDLEPGRAPGRAPDGSIVATGERSVRDGNTVGFPAVVTGATGATGAAGSAGVTGATGSRSSGREGGEEGVDAR